MNPHAFPCSSSDVRHSYSQSITFTDGAGSSKIDGPLYRRVLPDDGSLMYSFSGSDAMYSDSSRTDAYTGTSRSASSLP